MATIEKVSIALQPSVYSTFRALNNTVALTLSEYVDNAVQSYLDNKEQLQATSPDYKFYVKIHIDHQNDSITILDNAAGIDEKNYLRAFEPANIPLDATGLNEFGMGMKTASVWLADKWSVRTKALGESVERYTEFDLHKVIRENKEELVVEEIERAPQEHYTKITLNRLSKNAPSSNQMDKIKRHLSSIYRKFIRAGEIDIVINGELLNSPSYEVLTAPYHKTPDGEDIFWRKEINFELGKYKAQGFIAILKTIQNNANGLVLLRRGRVIVGGGEDRYFPQVIFGTSGNFRYKRLFGELELEGFDVTFNKNGFRDEDDLLAFMEAVRDELRDPSFNLFSQADNYR
ncbi:MAG: ATP-binding protein [Rikenellaceae bacterium]|nr:ATP-binding protein [Rikenellaceae bacterium]